MLFIAIMTYRSIKIADLERIAFLKEHYDAEFMAAAFSTPEEMYLIIEKIKSLNKMHLHKKRHARIITDELLRLYNSFSGESSDNLRKVYMECGFREHSANKIKSNKWELVAQGIRETAAMKDKNVLSSIKKMSRSKNTLVVENAQLSLVKINGFSGLGFLSETQHPISDWQQINLIETLKEYATSALPDFSQWLGAKENTVRLFAVRLIRYFKQIENSEKLYPLLNHESIKIKTEVIQTLGELGNRAALNKLINKYENEHQAIKLEIIRACALIGEPNTTELFTEWIKQTDDVELQKNCIESIIHLNAINELKLLSADDAVLKDKIKPFIDIR